MATVQSEARIIVGLDIGSEWSGFSFAHIASPKDMIMTLHNWPQGPMVKGFSKTLSAIYYEPGDAATAKVKSWGYIARTDYTRAIELKGLRPSEMSEVGTYFENFTDAREPSTALLRNGFTLTQIISDYLQLMGSFIMSAVQDMYGSGLSMNDVQWCVALAHVWGEHAMTLMRTSMERAGLVRSAILSGGSPHPLRFVRELEAASYHCLRENAFLEVTVGDKLLVADLGFESCHISLQEVYSWESSEFEVKQVAESVAVLGGQKQWDWMLMKLLLTKMPPVLKLEQVGRAFKERFEFYLTNPFDELCFNDGSNSTIFKYDLPATAAKEWEHFDVAHGNPIRDSYDEIEFTIVDIRSALKPWVDEIVAVIRHQLLSTPDCNTILLVGKLGSFKFVTAEIEKDLNYPVMLVERYSSFASRGTVAKVLDQSPNTWEGGDGAACSSHGDGITGRSSSPEMSEVPPTRGSTSSSSESSNAYGGGEASGPSLENKPSNSRVESVVKKYSWDQVLQMTEGLTSRKLGEGGFGTVYLGKFENGRKVAVKVLNQSSLEGKLETFANEVNLLIQINHVNLVKLLGYCEGERSVVIYEYAEEGSIRDHLHGDKTRITDWKQRLSMMLQAAYGLDYLHSSCSPTIIHRDIKSENILLTKNMVAKVADFGISKLMGVNDVYMKTHLTTEVIGSYWYIDPEYQETSQLRHSSDVYSFGIVLLEMISGRKPCGIGAWVIKLYGSGGGGAIKAIADSSFSGNFNPKAMKMVINLAISCIEANGVVRPKMREVVSLLVKAQSIEKEVKKSWFPFMR